VFATIGLFAPSKTPRAINERLGAVPTDDTDRVRFQAKIEKKEALVRAVQIR
jgi:hypothetical protein